MLIVVLNMFKVSNEYNNREILYETPLVNFEYIQHKIQHGNSFMHNVWSFFNIMHESVKLVLEAATGGNL